MGGIVESQLRQTIDGLSQRLYGQLEQVINQDLRVNELEIDVDDQCAHIIARRQPAASDLRLVLGVSKAVTDLERIGDKARKVARISLALFDQNVEIASGWVYDLRRLGERSSLQLTRALDAFARFDLEAAIEVMRQNPTLARESAAVTSAMIQAMTQRPESISVVLELMGIARAFDRVGDHATNIAEHLVYIIKGIDVRHRTLEQIESGLR